MELPKRNAGQPVKHILNAEVVKLHMQGLKDQEIAKIIGKSRTRVWQIIKQYRDKVQLSPVDK